MKTYLLAILFLLLSLGLPAQKESHENRLEIHSFDRVKWQQITRGLDYAKPLSSKAKDTRTALQETGNRGQDTAGKRNRPPSSFSTGPWALALKIGLVIAVLLALGFLLRALLGIPSKSVEEPRSLSASGNLDFQKIRDQLQETDLPALIQQAESVGDFSLATRLQYLNVLKVLSQNHCIRWRKDKTNGDFLEELKPAQLKADFSEITALFEKTWYGNIPPISTQYPYHKSRFQHFLHKIETIARTQPISVNNEIV